MKYTGVLLTLILFHPAFAQIPFPERCLGVWGGTLYMLRDGALTDSVEVRLTVARTSDSAAWSWKTEYLSRTRPAVKDYILRIKDRTKQTYSTDEGDGLELLDYRFGDKLYCVFATAGVMLTSSYELRGTELIFEVTSGAQQPTSHPEVTNYSVTALQRALLKRKPDTF